MSLARRPENKNIKEGIYVERYFLMPNNETLGKSTCSREPLKEVILFKKLVYVNISYTSVYNA